MVLSTTIDYDVLYPRYSQMQLHEKQQRAIPGWNPKKASGDSSPKLETRPTSTVWTPNIISPSTKTTKPGLEPIRNGSTTNLPLRKPVLKQHPQELTNGEAKAVRNTTAVETAKTPVHSKEDPKVIPSPRGLVNPLQAVKRILADPSVGFIYLIHAGRQHQDPYYLRYCTATIISCSPKRHCKISLCPQTLISLLLLVP